MDPIGMDEYYVGGPYVGQSVVGVPTSGPISLNDFRGKAANPAVLDCMSAGAQADVVVAYGFKLFRAAYTGPVARVRRGTDSALMDFYASTTGALGTAALGTGTSLSTWLGAATGYISTWYDQTGRGKHAAQATTTSQPSVVQSGGQASVYLNSALTLRGGNVFDTTTVTDMHISFASTEVTRSNNFLISLDGTSATGDRRLSVHAPWSSGVWYFDACDALDNRSESAANITAAGNRNVFSGYKSTADGKNGFRVNQGTRYLSALNAAANVAGGICMNTHESGTTANHYLHNLIVFKAKLGITDETYLERNL